MIKLIFKNKLLLGIPKSKQVEFFKESKSKSQTHMEIPVKINFLSTFRNCRILLNISSDLVGAFSSLVSQFCIILTPFSCSGNNGGYAFHYTWE